MEVVAKSHYAVGWASSEEFWPAKMAGAVFLLQQPGFGSQAVCLCLLTSLGASAHRPSQWTAGQHRSRSPWLARSHGERASPAVIRAGQTCE